MKSYYLKHRCKKFKKNLDIVYENYWKNIINYLIKKNKKQKKYEVYFNVNKDLSVLKGLEIKDRKQKSKLVITAKKNKLIFNTDADEFVLPNSYIPKDSEVKIEMGFFMCNNEDEIINFEKINLKNVNTKNMKNMRCLFRGCAFLTDIDFIGVDTSNIENMRAMFSYCKRLKNVININFNTSKVKDMTNMFYCCRKLENIDISGFDFSNVKNKEGMILCCNRFFIEKVIKVVGAHFLKLTDIYGEEYLKKYKTKNVIFQTINELPKHSEIYYYWHWKYVDDEDIKIIDKALRKHDYKTFKKYYDIYYADGYTFPKMAYVEIGYEIIGEIAIDSEEVITTLKESEYEYGVIG